MNLRATKAADFWLSFLPLIGRWAVEELYLLGRLEFVPESWRAPLAFGLRSCGATVLALGLAFFLQLDQPYWAGMAIWMVAQPTPGMAISKSYYRIVGTVVGSAMGVVLIALFAQSPELFILALALWIGACTVASNLLRNFRAYGAVLAGYTAAIIALGTYATPDHVFTIAMARASATIIGIACSAMITSLFAPHVAREAVMGRLKGVIGAMARRGAFAATAPLAEKLAIGKPLIDELIALDAGIGFAAAESAEFRIHEDGARSLLAHLVGALAAKRSLDARLLRSGELGHPEVTALRAEARKVLSEVPEKMEAGRWDELRTSFRELRSRLGVIGAEVPGMTKDEIVSARIVIDRLDDLLRHMGRALHDWERMQGGWRWQPSLRLNFHRDQRLALINGVRAFLAIQVAGIFWIESAWSSGSTLLIQVGVACSLFSAAPRPDKAGSAFLLGGTIAAAAAFFCNFFLLAQVSGFPLMALIYTAFLMPGAMTFLNPKLSPIGLAYCVSFLAISRPLNPMDYDVVSFLNNMIPTLGGIGVGVLAYKLFLPPDPRAARRYVVYRIRLGLQRISQWEPIPKPCDWQTRMFDRVNRLHEADNPSGTPTDEWLEGGLGAVNLGNEILRLRLLLKQGVLESRVVGMAGAVLHTFGELATNPYPAELVVRTVRDAMRLTEPAAEMGQRRAWFRTLGIFEEMEAFFEEHPGFLTPGRPEANL